MDNDILHSSADNCYWYRFSVALFVDGKVEAGKTAKNGWQAKNKTRRREGKEEAGKRKNRTPQQPTKLIPPPQPSSATLIAPKKFYLLC